MVFSSLHSRGNSAASAGDSSAPSSAGFQADTVPDGAAASASVNGGEGDLEDAVDERLLIDRMNVEGSYAFQVCYDCT